MRRLVSCMLAMLLAMMQVSVATAAGPFRDVQGTLAQEILEAYEAGIVSGYGDGTFRPDEPVTRAAFAKMIVTAVEGAMGKELPMGTEPFLDVDPGLALYPYVVKAYQAGYMKGYSDDTFGYAKAITRQEAAAILQRALNLQLRPETFRDVPDGSTFAQHIGAVAAAGIMKGYGDAFGPTQKLPRGQAAAIAYRAYQRLRTQVPAVGSKEKPVPLGVDHLVGEDWRVAVVSITEDAWPIIRETNMFNEPPAPGRQYVMARLRFTNDGTQPVSPWTDLSIRYLGSDEVVYGMGDADHCGVIPEPIYDIDELFPGGTAEANVCWSIPTSAVKGGRIMVEEWSAANDVRVFFEGVK